MKRLILLILTACAGALVVWRVTRDEEPRAAERWDPDGGPPPAA